MEVGAAAASRMRLLETQGLLDSVHEPSAEFLLLTVHGQRRYPRAEPNDQVTAMTRLIGGAVRFFREGAFR